MLGSTTLIFLIGPSFGAFRGSVRVVANSADETAVGGGHSESGMTGFSAKGISTTHVDPSGPHTGHSPSILTGKSPAFAVRDQPIVAPVDAENRSDSLGSYAVHLNVGEGTAGVANYAGTHVCR